MTQEWMLAGYDWGRRSRGATVRLGGVGEIIVGERCPVDDDYLCMMSAVEPGNYLVSRSDTRLVWQRERSQCARVSIYQSLSPMIDSSSVPSVLYQSLHN